MEFPEDILRIIYAFSRPSFKYFREYNRALRLHHITNWPSLKYALISFPDKVLNAIHEYEKAFLQANQYEIQHNLWFQHYLDNHCVEEEERHKRSLESIRKKFALATKREELHYLVNTVNP